MPTNVRLSDETWKRLNRRKEPGESFDDVIAALLDSTEEAEVARDA